MAKSKTSNSGATPAKGQNDLKPTGTQPDTTSDFPIVGIGASAGGLEAFSQLLGALPTDTGMALVLVQHLAPTHESLAPGILSRATHLPVREVQDGMHILPNHVYLIPPNTKMTLSNGVLSLFRRTETQGQALAIDSFFQSLALDQKSRAVGVILSGTGSDGTQGLKAIKAEGGLAFVQEPKSAKFDGMPKNAIASDAVDFISTPKEIALELARIAKHPYITVSSDKADKDSPFQPGQVEPDSNFDSALHKIFALLRGKTQVDFSNYKQTTLQRRIQRRMMVNKSLNLDAYAKYLEDNPSEVKALYADILIHVTDFFRDPDSYAQLRDQISSKLIKNRKKDTPLRVWVPGCSTGEEVYSLAILLLECLHNARIHAPIQIFATDISESAIQKARSGVYPAEIERSVSKQRLKHFFNRVEDGYKINKEIRDLCLFSRHDVTHDPPFSKLDLISCRNVLIYFTSVLQKNVISVFHYALNPGGLLWLGNSETPGSSKLFDLVNKSHRIYSKANISTPMTYRFPRNPLLPEVLTLKDQALQHFKTEDEFQKDTDKLTLLKYAPPAVIVNAEMEIVQFRGRTAPYLEPASGLPSSNLIKMARPELVHRLTKSIQLAAKQNLPVRTENLTFESDGRRRQVHIEVMPINPQSPAPQRRFVVFFEESPSTPTESKHDPHKGTDKENGDERAHQIIQLEQDLLMSAQHQQSIIEEFNATQEELTSTNEELQSANEELQSTNEELETAKEELQSSNEELNTVNDELQNRNSDLTVLSNDLHNLLVSTEIPILIVGSDHHIRRFTPKAEKAFNLIPSDVGRPVSDIRINFDLDLDGLVSQVMKSATAQEEEIQDHQGHWWRLQVRPYKTVENRIDGAVIAVIDIEGLKLQLELAKKAQDYILSVLETVRLPLVILDEQLRLISANKGFWDKFGFSRRLAGKRFLSIFELRGDEGKIATNKLHQLLASALNESRAPSDIEMDCEFSNIGECSLYFSAGQIQWVSESLQRPQAILLSIEDITESKRTKKAIDDLLRKEMHAREEADKANQTKDLFLATLSHELRTPLSAILAWSQMISQGKVDSEKAKQGAAVIERNALLQSQLIDDLLDISRIASGKISLEISEVDICAVARAAIESVRSMAEKKSIQINSEICKEPALVLADPTRLQQIFWNLLTNAIKFSPEHSSIGLRLSNVKKQDNDFAQVLVADSGNGIPPDFLPEIFDRFSQADNSSNREHGGLGLGLSIVQNLVKVFNGTVQAENASDGNGAIFTATFPVISPDNSAIIAAEKQELPKPEKCNASKSTQKLDALGILYVDDDDSTREAVSLLLKSFGAIVTAVGSAGEALEALTHLKPKPDVLVSDIAMPGEDGYSLIRKIRNLSDKQIGAIPALALTAYANVEDAKQALSAGFQAHLSKPVDGDKLARTILEVVDFSPQGLEVDSTHKPG